MLDDIKYSIEEKINFVKICEVAIQELEETLMAEQSKITNGNFDSFLDNWEETERRLQQYREAIARYKTIKKVTVGQLVSEPAFLSYAASINLESVTTKTESENEKAFK